MNEVTDNVLQVYAPGWYSVVVTNAYNLYATDSIEVVEYLLPSFEIITTNPSCVDSSNGMIQLLAASDSLSNIEWNNVSGDTLIEDLVAGEYNFTLTDINGCVQIGSQLLVDPLPLVVTVLADTACFGEKAFIDLTISGGTGIYTTDWMEPIADSLNAGMYSIEVTDENNCTNQTNFSVIENPELFVDFAVTNVTIENAGGIALNVSGGTMPYSYAWSNGSITSSIDNMPSGMYTCVIIDAEGCQAWQEFEILNLSVAELPHSFSIFPVPFENVLNIASSFPSEICITDALGTSVYFSTISKMLHTVNTENFSSGVYLISINHQVARLLKL
jgi:hypothetical protein